MLGGGTLREAWDRLAPETDNVFSTPEWADCWWRHFGSGCVPVTLTDDEAHPTMIVPLVRSGRALRKSRFVGTGRADQLGPVSDPANWHQAVSLIQRARDDDRLGADVLLLQDQPARSNWWRPLGGTALRTTASPTVLFPEGGWDAYMASRSKNMRSQMRTKENRLRREHDVVTRVSDTERLDEDLATFWRLHVDRWGDSAQFAKGAVRDFTEDFCHVAVDRGWLRLRLLEVDGVPQAAQLNFRYGGAESLYQAGRNPTLDDSSVGFMLTTDTLRSVCEDGLGQFRFLRGNDGYKYRFANVASDVQSIAVPLTPLGRLAVAVASRRTNRSEPTPVDLPPAP